MKPRFILSALLLMIITGSAAQNSQVLYFMNLPQNHFLNPALRPVNQIYVGIPGLSGINVNINNNFFSFSDIFIEGMNFSKESIAFLDPDFDRDKFLGSIRELNYFEPKVSVQLFGLGLTVGDGIHLFLDINDNAEINLVVPRDLIRLAFLGNENFAGQTFNMSETKADFNYYREIGIGASKDITPRLRFGAKARVLFGITAGTLQNYGLNLTVNEDLTNTLDANMALDISGPVRFYDTDSDGDIDDAEFDDSEIPGLMTNMRNAGFGLDLGAEYSVTDRIVLSAAITNVGFIRWKSNLSNIEAVGNIEFRGLDFDDIYNGTATIDELKDNFIDTLKQAMRIADTEKGFTTKLPLGTTLAGKYILNDKFSFGLLSYTRINGQQIREALTLSANMNISNKFTGSLAYTACNYDYSNIGIGVGVRASVAQFYFLIDRIPLSWKKAVIDDSSFLIPANWNTIHTRFGINLVFGNKEYNNYNNR